MCCLIFCCIKIYINGILQRIAFPAYWSHIFVQEVWNRMCGIHTLMHVLLIIEVLQIPVRKRMFFRCFLCSCGRLFGVRFWDWCRCGVVEVHVVFMVTVSCRAVICALIAETLLTPGSMKHGLHTSCWWLRSVYTQLKQKAACWN